MKRFEERIGQKCQDESVKHYASGIFDLTSSQFDPCLAVKFYETVN